MACEIALRRTMVGRWLSRLHVRHVVAALALLLSPLAASAQPFPQYIDQSNPATTPLTATDMIPVVQGPPGSGRATNKLAGNLLPTFLPADYSGNVAVNNANFCGQSVDLTGNAQATVTVSAASGFPNGCQIRFNNIDSAPASYPATGGHGRIFSGITLPTGYTGNILYPGTGGVIQNDNGTWILSEFPTRYKIALSTNVTIYVDPLNGSDSNDGFSVTTAMKNPQTCYYRALADVDFNSGDPGVICNIIHNSVDNTSGCMHLSGAGMLGGQGGIHMEFDGFDPVNSVNRTLTCTGNGVFQTFVNANLSMRRITLSSDTTCINAAYNSQIHISDGVVLNGCGTTGAIVITQNATVFADNGFTINSPYSYMINAAGGRFIGPAAAITGGIDTGTTLVIAQEHAIVDLSQTTFTGFTFTGQRANATLGGRIITATETCDTDLPGSIATTVSTGGWCGNLGAAVTQGGLVFAKLPPAVTGAMAYITDGKASNCGDSACTTFGTTITAGGGALQLLAWWNGANWTLVGK